MPVAHVPAQPAPEVPPPPGCIRVRRTAPGTSWTVGEVYTVDMNRDISRGSFPGVICDDTGDERVYFQMYFEPI